MGFQSFQPGQNLYGVGIGTRPESVEVPFITNRAPTTADTLYPIGKRWIWTGHSEYTLLSTSTVNGVTTANWALVTDGSGSLVSLTGDTGGPVLPLNGNINVKGGWTISCDGNLTANTLNIDPSVHGYPITSYVVGPPLFGGQIVTGYQSIQSALDALSGLFGSYSFYMQSGLFFEHLEFIRGGSFIQNINLIGAVVQTSNVAITGVGMNGTGDVPPGSSVMNFENILFSTVGSPNWFTFDPASGASSSSKLYFKNCNFDIADGYLLSLPEWEGNLTIDNCGIYNSEFGSSDGVIDNTGGTATVTINNSILGNGDTNSMNLFATTTILQTILNCPLVLGDGTFIIANTTFNEPVTISGSATGTFVDCTFNTGAAAALTMSSSAAVSLTNCIINSSNNPSIAGAGAGVLTLSNMTWLSNAAISGSLTLSGTTFNPTTNTSLSTGTLSVKSTSANPGNNTGFIELYVGGTLAYVPYFTNIHP